MTVSLAPGGVWKERESRVGGLLSDGSELPNEENNNRK